jgi:surface polysaccharide O-acyltransferase-like enzyme
VERFHALDSLRAVAMFLGIVLHAAVSFSLAPIPWVVRDAGRNFSFDVLIGFIHGFRMPLFFFIAGFFAHLVWQRGGTRAFLRQRGLRIGLPFLLGMITIIPVGAAVWLWAESYGGPMPRRPAINAATARAFPTMHLWFLEMLLMLYALAMLAAWAGGKLRLAAFATRLDAAFEAFIRSRWKPLVMVPPTMLCFWNGPMFGEVDLMGARLLFAPRAAAYFGLFFAVGWWLHRRVQLLDTLRGSLKTYFLIAFLAFMTLGACHRLRIQPADPEYLRVKLVALAAAALYAWSMTFAVTGLFLRIASRHRPWMRYLADASYWLYLWHLPLVMWLQVLVASSPVHAWLKFAFVLAASIAILLPSYHWLVRYTWLGRMLNGPREKPVRLAAATG